MNFLVFSSISLAIVALICNVISVATSAWMGNYGETSIGLFQTCLHDVCFSNSDIDNDLALGLKATAGLMLIPIPIHALSIIVMTCGSLKHDGTLTIVSSCFLLLCGFLILAAASIFTAVTNNSQAIIMTVMENLGGPQRGYGYTLAWVCFAITVVAAMLGLASQYVENGDKGRFDSIDVQVSTRKVHSPSLVSSQRPLLREDSYDD